MGHVNFVIDQESEIALSMICKVRKSTRKEMLPIILRKGLEYYMKEVDEYAQSIGSRLID